jgi:outer membrane receptor for ferrienterochelin and colicins
VHLLALDSATAEPLFGASAVLLPTDHTAGADMDGRITLQNVPDGSYTLRIVSVGYLPLEIPITLPRGGEALTVRLTSSTSELEEVVVSATRTNSRIDDAPQKIEVLGEEELHEESSLKPGNIASLIGDISSVQIQQTSGVSGASAVRMQGLDGRYTLLLRDGMPAFGGLSGGFDLLRIPPLDLQRVELLKGPSSTFNGGGAIAGTINFVSKAPMDSLGGMLLVNHASLSETNVNAYVSGPVGKVGFTLFGGGTLQDAVDVDGDGWSDLATTRTSVVHPQLYLSPWKAARLRVGGVYQHDQRTGGNMNAIDATGDTALYFLRTIGERIGADMSLEHVLSSASKLVAKGSVNNYTQQDRDNFTRIAREQANRYAEAYWTTRSDRRTWVFGGNYVGSALTGDGIGPQDISTLGAFVQLSLHRKRWPQIDFGLRTDKSRGYDPIVLPSVAAMFKVTDRLSLRANAGTGYQLPDRSRNYGTVSEGVVAARLNDGTKPELSTGGTIEWTWKKPLSEHTLLFVDQTFFATSIDHPLGVITDTEGISTLFNPPGTKLTRGIDNYIRLTHGHTELCLGYTWTLPEITTEGRTSLVSYTPQHRAATTLSHEFGEHWRAGIEASWSGQQSRTDGSLTRDQIFMAAMVGCTSGRWNVVLNGENLTDTRQTRWEEVVSGTDARPAFAPLWAPIDGRVINLSVLYHFGWMKK